MEMFIWDLESRSQLFLGQNLTNIFFQMLRLTFLIFKIQFFSMCLLFPICVVFVFDHTWLIQIVQEPEFLHGFRSAEQNRLGEVWDEIQRPPGALREDIDNFPFHPVLTQQPELTGKP